MIINSNGSLFGAVGNDSGSFTIGTYTNSLDTNWHHIAITWDTTLNNMKGYYDGTQVFDLSNNNWPSTIPDFVIGSGFSTDAQRQWDGVVDDVRVYDQELTASQISEIMGL